MSHCLAAGSITFWKKILFVSSSDAFSHFHVCPSVRPIQVNHLRIMIYRPSLKKGASLRWNYSIWGPIQRGAHEQIARTHLVSLYNLCYNFKKLTIKWKKVFSIENIKRCWEKSIDYKRQNTCRSQSNSITRTTQLMNETLLKKQRYKTEKDRRDLQELIEIN